MATYVPAGLSYRDAASQRAVEELGVRLELDDIGKTSMTDSGCLKFIRLLAARHEGPFRPDGRHVGRVRFAARGDLERHLREAPGTFTPTFRHVYGFYAERTRR